MIIEISALVISGIGDNQSPNNRVIKVTPDASCTLHNSLLKYAVKNFLLWVIAQIHFHLYEVQIF